MPPHENPKLGTSLPRHTRIVVVGGGIVGCSIAYHLAKAGQTDVVLVEKAQLGAGTTWHSAGNMETYRSDPLMFEFVRYGVELFPALERESGQQLGWRTTGRVMFTHLPERMAQYRTVPRLAEIRDIEVEALDPTELVKKFPILDPNGIEGGLWIPGDGRVNPHDLTVAFARAAKRLGVKIVENCEVARLVEKDGKVVGAETSQGMVHCDNVVVAGGLWSREICKTVGVELPLYALEHFYIITKGLEGVPKDLPMFLAFDDLLYGREEVGGLIVGCLDRNAIPRSVAELPSDFAFGLLDENWEQFEPYMETALQRFPILQNAQIRMLLNGPESFTPDAQMIIGPPPGIDGLFVAAGMNSNGIALSSCVGRTMAEWLAEGAPSLDIAPFDVRRFAKCQGAEQYMRARVADVPSYFVGMHGPGDDPPSSRNVRLSPLHSILEKAGASFKSAGAWERPIWFGAPGPETIDAESAAAINTLAVVDRSSDAIFHVKELPTSERLQRFSCRKLPSRDKACLTAVFNKNGKVSAIAWLARIGDEDWLVCAPPEQETYLREALGRGDDGLSTAECTGAFVKLRFIGPERERVRKCISSSLASSICASLPANGSIAGLPVLWFEEQAGAALNILTDASEFQFLMNELVKLFGPGGPPWAGWFAEEVIRVRERQPLFGADLSPFSEELLSEFGLTERADEPAELTAAFVTCERRLPLASVNDPIMYGGEPVGWSTSSCFDPSVGKSRAILRIKDGHADEELCLLVGDEQIPLTIER